MFMGAVRAMEPDMMLLNSRAMTTPGISFVHINQDFFKMNSRFYLHGANFENAS